jgi:hypothetical protein
VSNWILIYKLSMSLDKKFDDAMRESKRAMIMEESYKKSNK